MRASLVSRSITTASSLSLIFFSCSSVGFSVAINAMLLPSGAHSIRLMEILLRVNCQASPPLGEMSHSCFLAAITGLNLSRREFKGREIKSDKSEIGLQSHKIALLQPMKTLSLLPARIRILYVILGVLILVAVVPLWFYGTQVVSINRERLITNE